MQRIGSAVAKRKPDPMRFKIGITWNPPYRWANPKYGYMHDGYHHMEILAWDFRGAMIGLMEASLILHFQKEAPRLCLNVKVGDDNRQDMSGEVLPGLLGVPTTSARSKNKVPNCKVFLKILAA